MKKILAILIMLAALLASCEDSHSESSNIHYNIYIETIRGHEYIVIKSMNSSNIIHSASCPCKKGGDDE